MSFLQVLATERTGSRETYLRWNEEKGAYFMTSWGERIAIFETNREGMLHYFTKNYKALYPDFDPSKHFMGFISDIYDFRADSQSDKFLMEVRLATKSTPPPGVYRIGVTQGGDVYMKPEPRSMKKISIKVKTFDLKDDVATFFNDKDTSGARRNKKGILLYGPPGNGKSSDIDDLKDYAGENNIFMFSIDSEVPVSVVSGICRGLDNANIILVMEELTERIDRRSLEELLNFLDGETSIDNCYTIATTNHPEKLPPNLVDRPSRFETFIEYKKPSREQILELGKMMYISPDQAENLCGKDLSFDYVSFIFSKALKQNKSVLEVYEVEKEHRRRISETFKGKIGF